MRRKQQAVKHIFSGVDSETALTDNLDNRKKLIRYVHRKKRDGIPTDRSKDPGTPLGGRLKTQKWKVCANFLQSNRVLVLSSSTY
jgi:hypothetical protein